MENKLEPSCGMLESVTSDDSVLRGVLTDVLTDTRGLTRRWPLGQHVSRIKLITIYEWSARPCCSLH